MIYPKRIDINEFRNEGFLQELNRQFLHPLGLALEVMVEDDGHAFIAGVWDYRDDPEGLYYGKNMIDEAFISKAENVEKLRIEKAETRQKLLGFVIQPIDGK